MSELPANSVYLSVDEMDEILRHQASDTVTPAQYAEMRNRLAKLHEDPSRVITTEQIEAKIQSFLNRE